MTVSRNRYDEKVLTVQNDGKTYNTLVAKMATDYFNEENIKAKFHLDYIHKVQDGKFIGGVHVRGTNINYHDTMNMDGNGNAVAKRDAAEHQRLSHLRVTAADGNIYALLNDAGLHTKPDAFFAEQSSIGGLFAYAWANYGLVVYVNWESAYFLDSYECNLTVSTDGGNTQTIIESFENLYRNTLRRGVYDWYHQYTQGQTLTLTIEHDNQEGAIVKRASIVVGPAISQGALSSYLGSGSAPANTPITSYLLYRFTDDANPTYYTDDRMYLATNNIAPDGWYDIGDPDYYYYLSQGKVTSEYPKPIIVTKPVSIITRIKENSYVGFNISNPDAGYVNLTLKGVYLYESATATSHIGYISLSPQVKVETTDTVYSVDTSTYISSLPTNANYCQAYYAKISAPGRVDAMRTMILKDPGDRELQTI